MMPAALVVDGVLIVRGPGALRLQQRLRDTQPVDELDEELRRAIDQAVREHFEAYDSGAEVGNGGNDAASEFCRTELTINEVAAMLGLKPRAARNYAEQLGGWKDRSGVWRFFRADVEARIENVNRSRSSR
jgi:hypothetical protein